LHVRADNSLEADNAALRFHIEQLEMNHTKEREAAMKSVHSQRDAFTVAQKAIKNLQRSNHEADQLIEKLDEKINCLRDETKGLKDNNQILQNTNLALENDKKRLDVSIQGLQEEKQGLDTRVADLLVGHTTLRERIEALEKELQKTKKKAMAYSRKVKNVSLNL
jgi:chromosome segregation ATPase